MASEGRALQTPRDTELLKSNYLQLHYLTLKMSRQIKHVVIAGATGNLGSHILTALVSHGSFNIMVLTRKTGATFPAGVSAKVVDFSSPAELGLALQGQDAVVDAILSPDPTVSIGLIDAAVAAGVYRYIAPEFTIHPKYDKTRSLPIFRGKAQIYDHLQKVANDQKITWTAISNGAFLDWCLRTGFLNIDLIKKKVLLMNDGTRVFPLTVLPAVGTAVANALAQAEKTKNMHCSIYGVQKCQNEIADLAKEALGPDGWEVKSQDMEKAFEEALSATTIGNYSWTVVGDLIRYSLATPGYNGVFEQNHNDLLGVQPMSDEQVKALIKEIYDELKSAPH
ncbi:NAD(P)-binding protein [Aspergillus welwitschiae]|uniref:NAD(P)-binding protein n=1 Tax=Aspergillus welwitschiae TaxID=1341132 RepID=A0A3F3Q9Z4_9EURO|nr:NAD(P)-binding protein [Aspergillus welwitschiae]RDH35989.1 NAD(P)-binding protein [Aspergillus welwitschiae]